MYGINESLSTCCINHIQIVCFTADCWNIEKEVNKAFVEVLGIFQTEQKPKKVKYKTTIRERWGIANVNDEAKIKQAKYKIR